MPCTKEQLVQIGFQRAGNWRALGNQLEFHLIVDYANARSVVYAFVSEDEAKYIGKTDVSLQSRMHGYKNPGLTQTTNIAVKSRILSTISQGNQVEILVLTFKEPVQYAGINLDLASGMEGPLIRECSPPWNRLGVRAA